MHSRAQPLSLAAADGRSGQGNFGRDIKLMALAGGGLMKFLVGASIAILAATAAAAQSRSPMSDADLCVNGHDQGEEIGINACTRLIERNVGTPEEQRLYQLGRAIQLARAGDTQGSIADYSTVLPRITNDNRLKAKALALRGNTLLRAGETARGLADFDAAIAIDPGGAFVYLVRAEYFSAQKRFKEALADYDKVLAATPLNAGARNSACWIRAADLRTELEAARFHCAVALAVAPDEPSIYDTAGMLALREGQWRRAHQMYSLAVAGAPRDASALYGRGLALLAMGSETAGSADLAAATAIEAGIAAQYGEDAMTPAAVRAGAAGASKVTPVSVVTAGPFAIVGSEVTPLSLSQDFPVTKYAYRKADAKGVTQYWAPFMIAGKKGDRYRLAYDGPKAGDYAMRGLPIDHDRGLKITNVEGAALYGGPDMTVELTSDGLHRLAIGTWTSLTGQGSAMELPFWEYKIRFSKPNN